jgi:hypothetical protein
VFSTISVLIISIWRRRPGSTASRIARSVSNSSILAKIVAAALRYQASGSRTVRMILASGFAAASSFQIYVVGQSTVDA